MYSYRKCVRAISEISELSGVPKMYLTLTIYFEAVTTIIERLRNENEDKTKTHD